MSKSPVTCHVLDASLGKPAANVEVLLQKYSAGVTGSLMKLAEGTTDADGRCTSLLPPAPRLPPGTYKMTFFTGKYFEMNETESFYPIVEITFTLTSPDQHYHIPLLLSPWSYTTYRGS